MARFLRNHRQTLVNFFVSATVVGVIMLVLNWDFVEALWQCQTLFMPHLAGYAINPPPGSFHGITWAQLRQARMETNGPAFPPTVRDCDGKMVKIAGHMMDMPPSSRPSEFFLAPKLNVAEDCCGKRCAEYCVLHGRHDVIIVKPAAPLPYTRWPISVYGTLHLARGPHAKDFYILDQVTTVLGW